MDMCWYLGASTMFNAALQYPDDATRGIHPLYSSISLTPIYALVAVQRVSLSLYELSYLAL